MRANVGRDGIPRAGCQPALGGLFSSPRSYPNPSRSRA